MREFARRLRFKEMKPVFAPELGTTESKLNEQRKAMNNETMMQRLTKQPRLLMLVCGAVIACSSFLQAAPVYDFEADFSTNSNSETSTWSYRYQSGGLSRDGNYELLPFHHSTFSILSFGGWAPTSSTTQDPLVSVNTSGSANTFLPGCTAAAGASLIAPSATELVVVSFRAPASGSYDIQFAFTDICHANGDGIDWFVDRESSTNNLLMGSFGDGGTSGMRASTVALNAGERLNFVVHPKANNFNDTIRLFTRITQGSVVRLDIFPAVELVFLAETNKAYQVQYTAAVGPTHWMNFGEPITGNGFINSVFDRTRLSARRFYRLIENPQ